MNEVTDYGFLVIFGIVALLFCLITLCLASLWRRFFTPFNQGVVKRTAYECGLESKGDPWIRFGSEYYIYALVFLVFDVEVAFLVPFAVAFTTLPPGAFIAVCVFILLVVEGLVWAWRKGFLNWA